MVKLLFDEHISRNLVKLLADVYPDASHVSLVGLQQATDEVVWKFAGPNGYTVVTKDDDFRQRVFVRGPPPKVIWVRLGNCSTADIADVLRRRAPDVVAFHADLAAGLLVLTR